MPSSAPLMVSSTAPVHEALGDSGRPRRQSRRDECGSRVAGGDCSREQRASGARLVELVDGLGDIEDGEHSTDRDRCEHNGPCRPGPQPNGGEERHEHGAGDRTRRLDVDAEHLGGFAALVVCRFATPPRRRGPP